MPSQVHLPTLLQEIQNEQYPADMPAEDVEKARLEKHRPLLHRRRRNKGQVYLEGEN